MRLNFWQWLGVALLVVAVGLYIYRQTSQHTTDTPMQMNGPTTQGVRGAPGPVTHPATKGS